MQKEYLAPQVEEMLYCADEAINAVAPSAFNDGEFGDDTWT